MSSINPITQVAQQILLGSAVRQNHALEHATIVLLNRKYPDVRFAGISFAAGFFVFGDVPSEAILPAAKKALRLYLTPYQLLPSNRACAQTLAVPAMLPG